MSLSGVMATPRGQTNSTLPSASSPPNAVIFIGPVSSFVTFVTRLFPHSVTIMSPLSLAAALHGLLPKSKVSAGTGEKLLRQGLIGMASEVS